MIPQTDPLQFLDTAQLRRLDQQRTGKTFEVVCCYCGELHTHDYGNVDPDFPIITQRYAPCSPDQPYAVRWV